MIPRFLLTLGLPALLLLPNLACGQDEQSAPEPPPPAVEKADRELSYHQSVLENPTVDLDTRVMAAERLLEMGTAEAIEALASTLRSGMPERMEAVIRVLRSTPAAALIPPLVDALGTSSTDLLEPLIAALAAHNGDALAQLISRADDRARPDAERIGAIRALGAFPTPSSGDHLMALANPETGETPAIRSAAFDGLRRLAPTDFGNDFGAWQRWWIQARVQPREQWILEQNRRDRERIAVLEEARLRLAQRYTELLRELYVALSIEGQFERLSHDLVDELDTVRLFALNRIVLLLRDSVPIPESVQSVIVTRLDDPAPEARGLAARVLDQLDDPRLGEQLAERLEGETNSDVAADWLDVLAHRTTVAALGPVLTTLKTESLRRNALAALWTLARTVELTPEERESLRTALIAQRDAHGPTPGLLRLVALIGRDADVAELEDQLGTLAPDAAASTAEGLLLRGRTTAILAHYQLPTIYPFAVEALATGPATAEAAAQLIALVPQSEAHAALWDTGVRRLAERLAPTDILASDDILTGTDHASELLRETILLAAATRDAAAISVEDRVRLLERLLPMLVARNDWQRTRDLLELVNGNATDAALADYAFRAAVHLGRYDDAAAITAEPMKWITLLGTIVDTDLDLAARFRDEIARRFSAVLDDTMRTELNRLSDSIGERLAAAAADPETAIP